MISRATMNLKPAVIELDVGPASKCLELDAIKPERIVAKKRDAHERMGSCRDGRETENKISADFKIFNSTHLGNPDPHDASA